MPRVYVDRIEPGSYFKKIYMSKLVLISLLAFFLFTPSVIKADRVKPPNVILVNGEIPMYEIAAKMMVRHLEKHEKNVMATWDGDKLTITAAEKDEFFREVVDMYYNKEPSKFKFVHCKRGNPRDIMAIYLDANNIITQINPCTT